MKKCISMAMILMAITFMFLPSNTNALSINSSKNNFQILAKNTTAITNTDQVKNLNDGYNQEQTCAGILGDPDNEDSVAWLLQTLLNYAKVIGPLMVVVLSSIDFAKVIVMSDDDAMKKAQKKLGKRLVLAILLFFIPTIVQVLLAIFGITKNPTCGII